MLWDAKEITIRTLTAREIGRRYGIRVVFDDLSDCTNGFYKWHPHTAPLIVLARRLKDDQVLLKCTFWEELGHHFTATEEARQRPFTVYSRAERSNDLVLEKQALRWASVQLISDFEIRWFLKDGGGTLPDFARRFGVTEELALERINALQATNPGLWQYLVRFMAEHRA